jgi:hypothetical protein
MLKTEYKILHGRVDFLESQVNLMISQGWTLHGSTFPYANALTQVITKTRPIMDADILTESEAGC